MDQSKLALQQALLIKTAVYNVAKQLGSKEGFYMYWFAILPKCTTHRQAYEIVEVLHEKIFNSCRFSSYQSFKTQKSKHFKKLKNVSNKIR